MSNIVEGVHFYYNQEGLMVLTSTYHLQRGVCCGRGCMHCPYQYKNVASEKREQLLKDKPPILYLAPNTPK